MTTEQATRAAILSAVRAFVLERVEPLFVSRAGYCTDCGWINEHDDHCVYTEIVAELAALERAAAEGAPEGGSQGDSQETNAHE